MKTLLIAAALSAAALSAHATVTFSSYGGVPSGETLITDFTTNAGMTGGNMTTGSVYALTSAPAFSAAEQDARQYLSVPAGGAAVLTLDKFYKTLSVYIGSLDAYNTISFGPGQTFTGTQLGAISGGDNGDQHAAQTNGMFTFKLPVATNKITFTSSQPAFEVASVSAGAVPEPATWAMMIVGVAGIGAVMRRRAIVTA